MQIRRFDLPGSRDGAQARGFKLIAGEGVEVDLTNVGATILDVKTRDCRGTVASITHGYSRFEDYFRNPIYLGCTIGRYANRIRNASFHLDGREHVLAANEGRHQLHGGEDGFHRHVWAAEPIDATSEVAVRFHRTSRDGESGFPGNLDVAVTYSLNRRAELRITYEALSDQPTIINLTNHAAWNLGGDSKNDLSGHELTLFANRIVQTDDELIPTGSLCDVEGGLLLSRAQASLGPFDDAVAELRRYFELLSKSGRGAARKRRKS